MSKLELSEVARRYLFLRTELDECPNLASDEEFMRRYNTIHRMYKHYQKKHREVQEPNHLCHGFINNIRRYNDSGVI